MADRKISRKLKEKVMVSCVMPAYVYGLVTVAMTERTTEVSDLREQLSQYDLRE